MSQDLGNISRDVARKIARYVGNSFFSFSSLNRRLRGFFQKEREATLKKVKLFVKENGRSSYLLTYDGRLYACGENKEDHFGLGDKKEALPRDMKCYRQWTRIGPWDKKISEVVLTAENSIFVRCEKEWFGAGTHPYIQQAQREKPKSHTISSWVCVWGPEPFSIVELIPTSTSIFIRSKDGFCYAYNWDENTGNVFHLLTSSKIYWRRIATTLKNLEKMSMVEKKLFLQCSEEWYACGENKYGELGMGCVSDWSVWKRLGPAGKKVLQLKATSCNTFVYCDDEKWYGCGGNERGQLGTGDTASRSTWLEIGLKDKKISALYIQKGRTFMVSAENLYFCGARGYEKSTWVSLREEDYLNWTPVKWSNGEILDIVGKKDVIFIKGPKGWYGYGDDTFGILGRGYETWKRKPKKLNCFNKEIIQLVSSPYHVFVLCEDGWYFSGHNSEGQNGMNDVEHNRYHWIKVVSHHESIEHAVSTSEINTERLKTEPVALQFRHTLRKLYDPYYVLLLDNMFDSYLHIGRLKMGYNYTYEDKYRLFFFLEKWDFMCLNDSSVDEIPWRLRSLMGYSALIFLGDDHFNGGGFPWHLRGSEKQHYPFPTHWVEISVENYDAICQFLKGYEEMLDEYERDCNKNSEALRFHQ